MFKKRLERLESKILKTPLKIVILRRGERYKHNEKDKASIIIEFSEKVNVDEI